MNDGMGTGFLSIVAFATGMASQLAVLYVDWSA